MQAITYNLADNKGKSDNYYDAVKLCADEICESANVCGSLFDDYSYFLYSNYMIKRNKLECLVELLSFAILYSIYYATSVKLKKSIGMLLKYLVSTRKKNQTLKPYIDKIRGVLSGFIIIPNYVNEKNKAFLDLENYDNFILWLAASGEFTQESQRFSIVGKFLESLGADRIRQCISELLEFSENAENICIKRLSKYTSNVDNFIKSLSPSVKWREDAVLLMRKEQEYHMNMISAEILNRAYKENFKKSVNKIVILPVCMRKNSADVCKAVDTGTELICTSCDKNCNIAKIKALGAKNNFETVIIPHSSSLSKWGEKYYTRSSTGVIGVACPLSLLGGGWELNAMGFPAQCVLLNFSGCTSHWMTEAVSTELNIDYLLKKIS